MLHLPGKYLVLFGFTFCLSLTAFAQGNITRITNFDMPQLGWQRKLRIYLPKDYSTSNKTYPVLYMLDGQNLFKSDADIKSTWAVDSTISSFPANKQCIVIGIEHAGKDRITEYNPYDSKYGKGDGAAFIRFIVETLKPYIDTHYRTKKDAAHTAIAGSSLGSLMSTYAAVKYPDVFGDAGIFSPAFWIGMQIYTDTQNAQLNKKQGFYITCGDKESDEMVHDANKMDSLLHAEKFPLKQVPPLKINIGAIHNEAQWRAAFPAFYAWLAGRLGM